MGDIPPEVKRQSGFPWPNDSIKYLGIYITLSLDNLFEAKDGIIKTITNDLGRWDALPLSLLGRIESVYMNALPRFLYLFQMLPTNEIQNFSKT